MIATGRYSAAACAATIFLLLGISKPALADTFTLTNTPSNADGFVNLIPGGFNLFGADNSVGETATTYLATALSNQAFIVNWAYHTDDFPAFDPAGYYLNGVRTQLTNNVGSNNQSGPFLISVLAGDVYGFYVDSEDSGFGRANIQVTGFAAPEASEVPLPASLPLFAGGATLIALLGRRKRRDN